MKILLLILFPVTLLSQTVYLPATHPIYPYLDKMEAKQIISGYRDGVKPISREMIARFLVQIDTTSSKLSLVEQDEQFYFKEEFYQELEQIGYENIIEERWHLYQYKSEPGRFNVDLIGGYSYQQHANGLFTKTTSNGLGAYGYLGEDFGVNFMFRDNAESGSFMSTTYPLSSKPTQVLSKTTGSFINYSVIDAQVNMDIGFTTLSAEKMHNVWGAGERGNLILSDKAPSFPQIKLRARLGANVDFTYLHGWLYSDIIDSLRSFQSPDVSGFTGFRRVNRQKYIAAHILEFTPWDGIDLAVGESQIYGSRSPELLYMIPVMFFKAAEHWMLDTDNSQIFFTADINIFKNQNYYLSLFLDEFSTEEFTRDDRQRNQLGFTVGTSLYDIILPDTKINIEYTRTNPWVYNHRFPDATFQSHKINLGHWIGQNADLFSVNISYRPIRSLVAGVSFESLRKGGKDSTKLQYVLPTPEFLYSPLTKRQTLGLFGSYEPFRDVFFDFRILRTRYTSEITAKSFSYVNNRNEYILSPEYSGKWDILVAMRYNFD